MIPENLKTRRVAKGWSQEALARKADVSTSTVARIEQGVFEPRLDIARKLAGALECTLDELAAA